MLLKIRAFSARISLAQKEPSIDLRTTLFMFGIACLIVALARPQGDPVLEEREGQALDIVVMIDVSKSMLAEDVYPSRLGKAKRSVNAMLSRLDGDRVGLVAFAGSAVLVSPLTSDYSIVRTFLNAISADTIENQGTDIASAIQTSIQAFQRGSPKGLSADDKSHVLLLISDGEITSGEIDSGLKLLKENQIVLNAIGVGGDKPAPIPIRDAEGALNSYKQDRSGATVLTTMDTSTLKKLAEATGGFFSLSLPDDSEVVTVVEGLQNLNRTSTKTTKARIYREFFQWPLAVGLAAFMALFLLPLLHRRKKSTAVFTILLISFFSTVPAPAAEIPKWLLDEPSKKSRAAADLFAAEKYGESTAIYKSQQVDAPDSSEIAFNTATSLLMEGKKEEARALLEKIAGGADNTANRAQFNLAGSYAEEKKFDEALARYATLTQKLLERNPRSPEDENLLREVSKKIELTQKRREEEQKQKQDKDKENKEDQEKQKKDEKKDQQGSGNDKDSDKGKKENEPADKKDQENSKGSPDKKEQPQQKKYDFERRKKFKENEVLNEGDAKKILEALRQQEQLLQKKILQQKTITPRSTPANGKDW